MKLLFYKLSALLLMLMCVSATVQAEIVHHTVCQATPTSRGFTRECWENTETGQIYVDANCTQELVNEDLAKAVIYPKLPESPLSTLYKFNYGGHQSEKDVNFYYSATTSYDNDDREARSVEFIVTGDNVANARLVWYKSDRTRILYYGAFYVNIYVNGVMKIQDTSNNTMEEGGNVALIYVHSLPELKKGDVVKFEVIKIQPGSYDWGPTFKASLEYIGTFDNEDSPIVRHTIQEPTTSACGYSKMCWENKNTGKYYSDEACKNELKDMELAKTVLYAKFPESPITATNGFSQSEKENDWDVDLNWAGVTKYEKANANSEPRWVEFTASTPERESLVANARLVWNRNLADKINGYYIVRVYVNNVEKLSRNQYYSGSYEGVFVLPLPGLRRSDVVRFEVVQTDPASSYGGEPTFKASLEYNIVTCQHEYPAGSAICGICGYMKPHTHTYNPIHECTQCGYFDESSISMSGDLGGNIQWRLYNDWTLHYYGTGEMESFNIEHNAWKENYFDDVKKVVIGEGITKIGDGERAFDKSQSYFGSMWGLTEAILPSTLKSVGNSAFEYSSLSIVTLPEGLETIGDHAFRTTKLENIVIPASVTTLGEYAVGNCPFIKSITLMGTPETISQYAFYDLTNLKDFYLMGDEEIDVTDNVFYTNNIKNATLHVNTDVYYWATRTSPWNKFAAIVALHDFIIEFTDANNNQGGKYFDTEASGNTWTLTDGAFNNLTINEDIPMQKLTYTCNFTEANKWQALYVPFEMQPSDWAGKFDVAAISNFHEYINQNGETEKVELEVRYVKNGKLLPNIPYLIRAKVAGEQSIVLNNVTLKKTEVQSISCSSTKRKYTFSGTYDAIDGLQSKDYIFVSDGRLCKADNDTDMLKPMRWYLTIENRGGTTYTPSAALAKPMSIRLIGEGETTGIEDVEVISSPASDRNAYETYSIAGVKFAMPKQGINIINGKKVLVK